MFMPFVAYRQMTIILKGEFDPDSLIKSLEREQNTTDHWLSVNKMKINDTTLGGIF